MIKRRPRDLHVCGGVSKGPFPPLASPIHPEKCSAQARGPWHFRAAHWNYFPLLSIPGCCSEGGQGPCDLRTPLRNPAQLCTSSIPHDPASVHQLPQPQGCPARTASNAVHPQRHLCQSCLEPQRCSPAKHLLTRGPLAAFPPLCRFSAGDASPPL